MITAEVAQVFHCPRWKELPSIPLYMDQVVMILQEALDPFAEDGEPVITATMINNYVKQKLLDPPEKKRYTRSHVAHLIVLSLFKKLFSMTEINGIIERMTLDAPLEEAYDAFCDTLETDLTGAFSGKDYMVRMVAGDAHDLLRVAISALTCKLLAQSALNITK